jgi:hypothetical protein
MIRILRQKAGAGRAVVVGLAVAFATASAQGQPADSALPSQDPSQQGPEPALDTPETDSRNVPAAGDALPPGHPPVDSIQAAEDGTAPGTAPESLLSRDTVSYSNAVPVGALEIHVLDAENHPVPDATVLVQLHRESVSEGNTETKREVVTDAAGKARVDRLLTDSAVSYRVKVRDGGVSYGMQPFQLNEHTGAIVTIHKYALSRDLKQAMVAMQSLVFVEPKDDVFQFEVVYDMYNVGKTTWVPDRLSLRLPSHWKAFNAQQSGEDVHVESAEEGVRITGAVPPGQHQVTYTFQVPRENTPNASFELDLPPNTMMSKVGLASGRNSELSVEGFADPEPTANQNGQHLLVTTKTYDRSTQMPTDLRFEVRGLPTIGIGRVVAAVLSIVVAVLGLLFALTKRGRGQAERQAHSLQERARERLMEELAELESAKVNGQIGPRTYEETRNTLVEALVRLEPLTE